MSDHAITEPAGGEILLLFFASTKETMGRDRMTMTCETGDTVRAVVVRAARVAGVDADELLNGRLMFAVNHERVDVDHPVAPGDEVALLPPLSGGL